MENKKSGFETRMNDFGFVVESNQDKDINKAEKRMSDLKKRVREAKSLQK